MFLMKIEMFRALCDVDFIASPERPRNAQLNFDRNMRTTSSTSRCIIRSARKRKQTSACGESWPWICVNVKRWLGLGILQPPTGSDYCFNNQLYSWILNNNKASIIILAYDLNRSKYEVRRCFALIAINQYLFFQRSTSSSSSSFVLHAYAMQSGEMASVECIWCVREHVITSNWYIMAWCPTYDSNTTCVMEIWSNCLLLHAIYAFEWIFFIFNPAQVRNYHYHLVRSFARSLGKWWPIYWCAQHGTTVSWMLFSNAKPKLCRPQ